MKIVFLDSRYITTGDLSWSEIEQYGDLEVYMSSTPEEGLARAADADIVLVDKFVMDRNAIESMPNLKMIAVAATGYNQVDLEAASERGIAVANVPAYSTDAVAQHTFALILGIANHVSRLDRMIVDEGWTEARASVYSTNPITLLAGKSIGIVGYGNIGSKVGEIAEAFGMRVNIYSRNRQAAVSSDFVSLHCPLNKNTAKLVNREFISEMKDGAYLINTSRGGLVDEDALHDALVSGKLAGAGLDVAADEPAPYDPVIHLPNVLMTPHIAFAPKETRASIIRICGENIGAFLEGRNNNRIV